VLALLAGGGPKLVMRRAERKSGLEKEQVVSSDYLLAESNVVDSLFAEFSQ